VALIDPRTAAITAQSITERKRRGGACSEELEFISSGQRILAAFAPTITLHTSHHSHARTKRKMQEHLDDTFGQAEAGAKQWLLRSNT